MRAGPCSGPQASQAHSQSKKMQKNTCGSTVFSTGHPRQYSLAPAMLVCADRTRRGMFIAVWPQMNVHFCCGYKTPSDTAANRVLVVRACTAGTTTLGNFMQSLCWLFTLEWDFFDYSKSGLWVHPGLPPKHHIDVKIMSKKSLIVVASSLCRRRAWLSDRNVSWPGIIPIAGTGLLSTGAITPRGIPNCSFLYLEIKHTSLET